LNTLLMFRNSPVMDLCNVENLAKRIINIPSSPFLGKAYA